MNYGIGGLPDVTSTINQRRGPGIGRGMGGSSIPGLDSLLGMGGTNPMGQPMSGPVGDPSGLNSMTSSGGMNAMDSLQAHGNFGTRFANNPGGF